MENIFYIKIRCHGLEVQHHYLLVMSYCGVLLLNSLGLALDYKMVTFFFSAIVRINVFKVVICQKLYR